MKKIIMLAGLLAGLPTYVTAEDYQTEDTAAAAGLAWQGNAATSIAQQETLLAHDDANWQQIWRRIGQPAPMALPDDKIAVAIFAGQKRSGGYAVEFVNVAENKTQITVRYRITAPGLQDMVTQALTSPYALQLVPRHNKPVVTEQVH